MRAASGAVVGSGFLAAPGLVCTCAQTVSRALGLPDEAPPPIAAEVTFDFPFVADGTVHAVVTRWLPVQPPGGGDIAILRLTTVAPTGATPALLLVESTVTGRRIEILRDLEEAAKRRWVSGTAGDGLPTGWAQLEDMAIRGYRGPPSAIGAPVWDPEAQGVIGMLTAADHAPTAGTAFMIPASALVEVEPTLARTPMTHSEGPSALPSGAVSFLSRTVTFLFTDIEGSTRLWERRPHAMAAAVARHDALLRTVIAAHRGHVFKTIGDAFCAAFETTVDALEAAIDAQRRLAAEPWSGTGPLRTRMALHVSDVEERDADYFGRPLNRLTRLLATGHGGQILLSAAAQSLVQSTLPADVHLHDLGEHRLKDLLHAEHIYQVVVPDLPADFPPLKSLDRVHHNLPVQLTPFVGRAQQVEEVTHLLRTDGVRLVTLTGPGGIGKTRLGLQAAAALSDDFVDGVWFVPLAAIADSTKVAAGIASALEIWEHGGESDFKSVALHLADKHLLLVLDNFEHVLGAASLVADLLIACPSLKIVITSREALMLPGERGYPVPPMQLPARQSLPAVDTVAQYEGIRLFVERASEKRHDFALTEANAPVVVEICHWLDGLPLAIELAAARVGYFPSLRDLRARLAQRLPELKRRAPNLPERLRTMHASIAWSYNWLEPAERTLFRRLALFSGGCTLEAVEAVCADDSGLTNEVMDGLASLIDKSLVQPEESAGGSRYRMYETIREYGLGELRANGEEAATRERHADYFLGLAERAAPKLDSPEQTSWLDRLEVDHDNLRAALEWTLGQPDGNLALRLAVALQPFWQIRGYLREGYDGLERALATESPLEPRLQARALYGLGRVAFDLGEYARVPAWFEASLQLWREVGDRTCIAETLTNLGFAVAARGEHERARSLHEEALALWRDVGDTRGVASVLYRLGNLAQDEGDYGRARSLYLEALTKYRAPEDTIRIANLHWVLGATARLEGDSAAAAQLIEQSLTLFHRVDNKIGIGNAYLELGHASRQQGNNQQAERYYVEALVLFRKLGSKPGMVEGLEALAGIAAGHGRAEHAARLLGAATRWREILGQPFVPAADRVTVERLVGEVRQQAEAAFVAGQGLSIDDAVAEGLAALTFPEGTTPTAPRAEHTHAS